ncbi:MAG: molybdopterin molybdotransferase MoeA [Desulfuromonadales bacterium]|nr:molybdopterin molybdotransferase MoeA [Desulfuromonadales bacterium]NIR32955.1 molybdopterin molybdotransferase MoeA [Desulfuromonadales bacterium]NIS40513.1 molybdopterin molybdotransferase MoeA [Desulfuromonadales bacterium]
MLSYEEAIERIDRTVLPLPPVAVALTEARGRVLAEPVRSRWDLPPSTNSAMDGYAFGFAGQTSGAKLRLAGFVPAGSDQHGRIDTGCCVKIMTGASLPVGCDTVVPVEDVVAMEEEIRLESDVRPGQHVRHQGEEARGGEILLPSGIELRPGEIALLASAGVEQVVVHPSPTVAVLSTGDELVELGAAPGPGQIVNSNYYLLAGRLAEEDCHVLPLGIASDERADLAQRLQRGLEADMLISTGGVSMGDRDLVRPVLSDHGFELGFWKVRIKPGKPVLFGTAGRSVVFGLPGNPAASAATFELFVRPALRRMAGFRDILPPRLRTVLTEGITGGASRQRFIWGTLHEEQGAYFFNPGSRQGSGQNRSMCGAQALLSVPAGEAGLAEGSQVDVMLLRLPPGIAALP